MADSAAVGDGGYAWISMFRRPLLEASARDLAEADQLARSDKREVVRQRLAFVRLGFDYTEAVTEMFEAHYPNDPPAVLEWTQKAIERINKTSQQRTAGLLCFAGGRPDTLLVDAPPLEDSGLGPAPPLTQGHCEELS